MHAKLTRIATQPGERCDTRLNDSCDYATPACVQDGDGAIRLISDVDRDTVSDRDREQEAG
jgi:hypothetical protein